LWMRRRERRRMRRMRMMKKGEIDMRIVRRRVYDLSGALTKTTSPKAIYLAHEKLVEISEEHASNHVYYSHTDLWPADYTLPPPICPINNASIFSPTFTFPPPAGKHSNAFAAFRLPILELLCPPVVTACSKPSLPAVTVAR